MKQCPVCQITYTDDSLQYCLEDGATLSFSSGEQPTQIISPVNNEDGATLSYSSGEQPTQIISPVNNPINNPMRVTIARDSSQALVAEPPQLSNEPKKKEGSGYNLIIGLVGGFIISAILAIIIFAGILWMRNKESGQVTPGKNLMTSPTSTPLSSPTPDEAAILKEKIANLEKKMQEQKNQKPNVPTISNTNPGSTKVTARVSSPGDGFLALRTYPSAATGDRILQIPHGASVTVMACLPKAAGKKGRWCRVDYNGNIGWAFDGFLIY